MHIKLIDAEYDTLRICHAFCIVRQSLAYNNKRKLGSKLCGRLLLLLYRMRVNDPEYNMSRWQRYLR